MKLSEVNKQILDAIVISSNSEHAGETGNIVILNKEDVKNSYNYTTTKCTLFIPVDYDAKLADYVENENTETTEDDRNIYVSSKNGYVSWEFNKNEDGKIVKFSLRTKPMLTDKIRNAKDDELDFNKVTEDLATIQDSYKGILAIYELITSLNF